MKKSYFYGLSLLVVGMTFVGCVKNDVEYDENFAYKQKAAMYEEAFVEQFGSIAANHDWGFSQTTGSSASTRGAIAGSKNDKNFDCAFIVPDDIVESKNGNLANMCEALFNSETGSTTCSITFDNYWLQHLNTPQGDQNKMSQLQAFDSNAKNGTGEWIDVTNFTHGKNETNNYFKVNTKAKGATLMVNMGGTGDPNNGNKLFRWLEITEKNGKKDTAYHYDYKFLQCNVKKNKKSLNEMVLGFYGGSHWWLIVVKAAQPTNPNNYVVEEGRIMCEDLGDKEYSDFDFNDIVFDAKRYYNGTIKITIRAAGGKLPISVAGEEVTLGQMTNTGVNENTTLQEIVIQPKSTGVPAYPSIRDIPVVVTPGADAVPYELKTVNGKAPQKICCPINTHWAEEYVGIDDAYTKFADWVRTNDSQEWIEVEVDELTDLDLTTKPIK